MKQTETTFKVRGVGSFPFDMLRYDCCWPLTAEDSAKIEAVGNRDKGVGAITLTTNKRFGPTEARWESFMWRVVGYV